MKYIALALIVAVAIYFLFFKKEMYDATTINLDPKNNENDARIVNYISQLKNAKTENAKKTLSENFGEFIDVNQLTSDQRIALKKIEDELLN